MSEALQNCLMIIALNLAGMLVVYSVLAFVLARLAWHDRGMASVLLAIFIAQIFWIAPALVILGLNGADALAAWTIWFGNWLVSGCSVLILGQAVRGIPRQIEDAARMDGSGSFGIFRHVILPFVRRELGLIAILTVMATLVPFWAFVTAPAAGDSITVFESVSSPAMRIGMMLAGSIIGMFPILALFFLAWRRPFPLSTP